MKHFGVFHSFIKFIKGNILTIKENNLKSICFSNLLINPFQNKLNCKMNTLFGENNKVNQPKDVIPIKHLQNKDQARILLE